MYLSVGGEAGKREITLSGDGTFSAFADIGDKRTGRIALVLPSRAPPSSAQRRTA